MYKCSRQCSWIYAGLMMGAVMASPAWAQLDAVPTVPAVAAPSVPPLTADQSAPSYVPEGAAKEIIGINERLAVLSAQLAELELQAKIAAKIAEINKYESGDDGGGRGSATPPPPINVSAVPALSVERAMNLDVMGTPLIKSIDGVDGAMRATVVLENGTLQVVRKGDKIGSMTITSIGIDGVEAKEGKQMINLPFYDHVQPDDSDKSRSGGILPSL